MFAPPPSRLLPLLGSDVPRELAPFLDALSTDQTRRALAAGLYLEGALSLVLAARLAGMDPASFSQRLEAGGLVRVSSQGANAAAAGSAPRPHDVELVSLASR